MKQSRWLRTVFGATVLVLPVACGDGEQVSAQTRPVAAIRQEQRMLQRPLPIDTATAFALSSAFRAAASRALPAVVRINAITIVRPSTSQAGRPQARDPRRSRATGSGFLLDEQGHILTNFHLVANAEAMSVVFADGRDTQAKLVAGDRNTDVAVIRVETERLGDEIAPAIIADSDSLRVGDWVLALGNPLGLSFTVTAGIVSAKGRDIRILENEEGTQLEAFIQTDAAINPGNSGGPLVDLYGRVVGINTAIESQNGFFGGAGFAIPINLARKVANDLIRFGAVHRPRLGVVIQDVNAADAELYKLSTISGVEIASLSPGLPAEKAGLQMGDVVVALDGISIATVAELQDRIARLQPGAKVRLGIIRYGQPLDVSVELAQFEPAAQIVSPSLASDAPRLGFTVELVPPDEAARVGLTGDSKVRISGVDRFGPAFEANVLPGRVVLSINGKEVRSVDDVDRISRELKPGQVVSLVLILPGDADAAPTIFNYRLR